MSDCAKPEDDLRTNTRENNRQATGEAGRALAAGLLGGIASAVGYVVYSRLPDEQKDRLHQQIRNVVESRLNEIRASLNF